MTANGRTTNEPIKPPAKATEWLAPSSSLSWPQAVFMIALLGFLAFESWLFFGLK